MTFLEIMAIFGKLGVIVITGFLILWIAGIILQATKHISKSTTNNTKVKENVIFLDIHDKKDKDFYMYCINVLQNYKTSVFCEAFGDDIDKTIKVLNVTSDTEMYNKNLATLITYFNIYTYEHILDVHDKNKIKEYIDTKMESLNDTAKNKIGKIIIEYAKYIDESTVMFLAYYSNIAKDKRVNLLKPYAGKKYFLPALPK